MSIREKFVEKFGEKEAAAIEAAANYHENGINSERKGSDPFKWALLIAIGYDCIKKDGFRDWHKITASFEELKTWIREHAELGTHDGDCDYLSLFCGAYNEFIPEKAETAK